MTIHSFLVFVVMHVCIMEQRVFAQIEVAVISLDSVIPQTIIIRMLHC